MNMPLLDDIIIIFGLAIGVLFICHRLRVPSVVGLLFTGILVGPYGLGLVKGIHEVEIIAEIGVVLLLFTIGIEFSLERLLQIKKAVLMGGSLQVVLTFLATLFIARQFGRSFEEGIFIGFLVALSSTAIVLRLLQERAEIDSPHGRTTLGILIFQDIAIVPMILATPLLAGQAGSVGISILVLLGKGLVIVLLVIASAKWIVPNMLYQIARTRNHELFLLGVMVICFGVAWLTSKAGLSLALGAFLAGLIVSESEYSHRALGNILPFRDVFTTFFFVSIGMMLDVAFLFGQPVLILLIAAGVLILKAGIAGLAALIMGLPLRIAILVGLALAQIGEFSFILSRAGLEYDLLTPRDYQMFLAVSVLSMAATPFIITLAPRLADYSLRLPLAQRLKSGRHPLSEKTGVERKDHLIVVGFGVNGRNVARAARVAGISYAIIEMNPDTVRREQARGEPILYGDASHGAVLDHVQLNAARIVVVAINDPTATRRIVEIVRRLNPNVHLIVRTRYLQEMKPLYTLGADEVLPEEFETSVEIFTRVLTKYLVPRDEIEKLIAEVRADGYEMLRTPKKHSASLGDLKNHLHDVDVGTFRISPESPLIGNTLVQLDLRRRFGVSIVAIRRDSQVLANPDADTPLRTEDVLFVLGSPERIAEANKILV